jgi:serine/threonine protein kinase/ankyrin repeat protein
MKDVVVTHHMTYHVSADHKRNVVSLLGLGFEHVNYDSLQGPTLAPVIALEYAPYGTLSDLYYSSAFLSSYQCKLWLLGDIADGLQALHFSNIIHGDIKPDNILIFGDKDRGMMAKISDFGLSIIDPDAGPTHQALPGGTACYSAPEVSAGRPINRDHLKCTDIYSFGIVVWQTLLGGVLPFFSPRYHGGQPLSELQICQLKDGRHQELAEVYGITLDRETFEQLSKAKEQDTGDSEPPRDAVNELLVAMARDSLEQRTMKGKEAENATTQDRGMIPRAELPALLSLLQICLSSNPVCRRLGPVQLLLGKKYERSEIAISKIIWQAKVDQALMTKLNFQTVTARLRELYSSVFEGFFVTLKRRSDASSLSKLSRSDKMLGRHLAYALFEAYSYKFLSGDQSKKTRESILQYLFLASCLGNISAATTSLSIHELLKSEMKQSSLYATGTAVALLEGDTTLSWYEHQPQYSSFRAQLTKGRIKSSQEGIDTEQNRVAATVLLNQDVGPIDVDSQNEAGDTLLHIAVRSGNTPLFFNLVHDHNASVSLKNKLGEEPLMWIHRIEGEYVEGMAMLLLKAGADIETSAPARRGKDVISETITAGSLLITPLLRAIQARNIAAVAALVQFGADVANKPGNKYTGLEISPVGMAAAMLEHECLEILLPSWQPKSIDGDPDASETRYLWEIAMGGIKRIDLIKLHGDQYSVRIRRTLEVLTKHLGPCFLVRNARSSLDYAVHGGDSLWVTAILNNLYSNPSRAVFSDLQLGLSRAIAQGHREIAKTLMGFGALPLLPEEWAVSSFTLGRPGPWSSDLIARLVQETFTTGRPVTQTQCCLHFLASGGADAVAIAKDILTKPIVDKRMQPLISKPSSATWDIYALTDDNLWTIPRLDRPDKDGNTPLYYAMVHGEFELAGYLIEQGATCYSKDVSLPAQLFESGGANLVSQIEFLLKTLGSSFQFKIRCQVFDRLYPQSHPMMDKEIDSISWPTEEHTILTAVAHLCGRLDSFEKRQLWSAVLPRFGDKTHLLTKSESGRHPLQICIEQADHESVKELVDHLKTSNSIDHFSSIDHAQELLLAIEPPPRITSSTMKRRIIRYRSSLGEIVRSLYGAGDRCKVKQPELEHKILEILKNEYPILVTGYEQRGFNAKSKEQFKADSEELCNALLAGLYSHREPGSDRQRVVRALDDGLKKLFSPYFDVKLDPGDDVSSRGAWAKLTYKSQSAMVTENIPKGGQRLIGNDRSTVPLLDWNLYRKVCRIESACKDPLRLEGIPPLSDLETAGLISLGFVHGNMRVAVPSSESLTARFLRMAYPSRRAYQTQAVERSTPAYYFGTPPSQLRPTDQFFQTERSKRNFVKVLRQRVPETTSVPERDTVLRTRESLITHVESLIHTRKGAKSSDSTLQHPLFGRLRGESAYMDLPLEAYTQGARRLRSRYANHYTAIGMELPDDLKALYLNSDDEDSKPDGR